MPMPSLNHLRICTDSAIGLISAYSSLYARDRIKYTFVAIHSIFMAPVAMLYAIRSSTSLCQELTKPVINPDQDLDISDPVTRHVQWAVGLEKNVPTLLKDWFYSDVV